MTSENDPKRGFSASSYDDVTPAATVADMPWSAAGAAEYLYIKTAGDLIIESASGYTLALTAVPAGTWWWGRTTVVLVGTTAEVVGFW